MRGDWRPCIYTGQDMKTAHTGLHITDADWNASAADLVETLNKFKVPQKEQDEVMAAIGGLRAISWEGENTGPRD